LPDSTNQYKKKHEIGIDAFHCTGITFEHFSIIQA
jgi:hypothetical protein